MTVSANKRRASTKVPQLVILACLSAIFVLYAWPKFIPSGQSPVTRNQQLLALALETYFVDHGAYPVAVPFNFDTPEKQALAQAGGTSARTLFTGSSTLAGLTTPVAYATTLFQDPYAPEGLSFAYYTDGPGWVLYSPGSDGDYDLVPKDDYDGTTVQPTIKIQLKRYDPTNGTNSSGDVIRVKQ